MTYTPSLEQRVRTLEDARLGCFGALCLTVFLYAALWVIGCYVPITRHDAAKRQDYICFPRDVSLLPWNFDEHRMACVAVDHWAKRGAK